MPKDKKIVSLPHDAMLGEVRSLKSKGKHHISWHEGLDYVYEKEFFVPDEYADNLIIFEFEGVYKDARVFINDQLAHYRPYGYSNFYVDAGGLLKYGANNIIKVTVLNSDQPNSRWYSGTGIYRPVSMYILPQKHININGIKITTLSINPAAIRLEINTNAAGDITAQISGNGFYHIEAAKTDGQIIFDIKVPDAKLWDCNHPALYDCKVTFFDDVQSVKFGIRLIECDSKRGFLLNGKKTLLLGACIHHDNGLLGAEAHSFAERRKILLLKQAGYNAIRSAHNPCSKAMLNACDELGMMVVDEYSDMWYIHKNKYDYALHMQRWWRQDLTDMVEKDYNHPSVVMYSIGNEVAETSQKKGIELVKEMVAYIKGMDNRPVTCGINLFFNYLYSMGFGVYSDKKANKQNGRAVGSEFFNKLAGWLGDKTMKIGATLAGSDRKTKDAYAALDVAGYNYGILRYKKDIKKYPDRVILGTETFCKDAPLFIELAEQSNAVIGDFVWAGMDYLGEAAIGSWVCRDNIDKSDKSGWLTAGSGRIDITGKASAETAFTRVAFGLEKIELAVQPVHEFGKQHSPSAWKASRALQNWTYHGCEGRRTIVEVYSKAPCIALYLNGKKIAQKKCGKSGRSDFKVRYYPGELTAVATDKKGNELARKSLITGKKQVFLTIMPENERIPLKGGLCYARIKFCDDEGIVLPNYNAKVELHVQNGELLAFGNACPYNKEGYKNHTASTYYGEVLAIIKPVKAGVIKIQAKSGTLAAIAKTVVEKSALE